MRLSQKSIDELKKILKSETGKDYSNEEAQEAGLAIMRFVLAKEQRELQSHSEQLEKTIRNRH